MGDKDKKEIEELKKDLGKWKQRAIDAAMIACSECDQVRQQCENCKCRRILDDAGK